jgi:hypothetical protein
VWHGVPFFVCDAVVVLVFLLRWHPVLTLALASGFDAGAGIRVMLSVY